MGRATCHDCNEGTYSDGAANCTASSCDVTAKDGKSRNEGQAECEDCAAGKQSAGGTRKSDCVQRTLPTGNQAFCTRESPKDQRQAAEPCPKGRVLSAFETKSAKSANWASTTDRFESPQWTYATITLVMTAR